MNPIHKCPGAALHFRAAAVEYIADPVVEERVLEALQRRDEVGLRLGAKAARGETGKNLFVEQLQDAGAHACISKNLPHGLFCAARLPSPNVGEVGVAEIEDVQFKARIKLQIVGINDMGMLKRLGQTGLALDRPERVELGDRAGGFDRLRNDAIDERVANRHFLLEPALEVGAFTPLVREVGQLATQRLAVAADPSQGSTSNGAALHS